MTRFRVVLRWCWAVLLVTSGAMWWAKRRLRKRRAVVVLTLHRTLNDTEVQRTNSLSGIILRQSTFEQLTLYVLRTCEVVDLARCGERVHSDKVRIAFTFDDGWADNYSAAYPVALRHGLPITIFICPGLVGRNSPFWPEQVAASIRAGRPEAPESEIADIIERFKVCSTENRDEALATINRRPDPEGPDATLSWAQIAEMDAGGITFGAHTQTHQVLTTIAADAARQEIVESKNVIEKTLRKKCDLFAYPNGNHSAATRRMVEKEGFSFAFTTERRAWTAGCDPLAIPRSNLSESDVAGPWGEFSPAMFEYLAFWRTARTLTRDRHAAI